MVEGGELAQTMGAATQLITQVMGASGRKDFWKEVWDSASRGEAPGNAGKDRSYGAEVGLERMLPLV